MPVVEESVFIARPPQDVFDAAPGGTKLTYRIDAASGLGGVFGRLADPFIEKAQSRTVRANLETLAELLFDHQGK